MTRKPMNIAAIAKAVDARMGQLDLKGVGPVEIARRMGSNQTNVYNLRHADTVGKKSFTAANLRAASRALEWPADALQRIEAGEVTPDALPDVPWAGDDGDVTQLLTELVARLESLERQAERRDRQADEQYEALVRRVETLEHRGVR